MWVSHWETMIAGQKLTKKNVRLYLDGSIAKLDLFAEELAVSKEKLETGRLHVAKRTVTSEAHVDEELAHEDAIVETVPMGHRIFVAPVTRVVATPRSSRSSKRFSTPRSA